MGWVLGSAVVFLITSAVAAATVRALPDDGERSPLLSSQDG